MSEEYIKQLEETNEKLTKLAEENSQMAELFKYVLSRGVMEVILDGSGNFLFTFEGNMVKVDADHLVKEFAKQYKGWKMTDKLAARIAESDKRRKM